MDRRRRYRCCRRTRWQTRSSTAWRRCCVSDPREQLRRYLEQRRELGERELVLDQLSVEEALRIVSGAPRAPRAERAPEGAAEGPPASKAAEEPPPNAWRETLRAAGAAPARGAAKRVRASEGMPSSTPEGAGQLAPAGTVA